MPNLTFKSDTHEYFLDGVKIPGFSEIAKVMGIFDFSNVPEYILETARNFGDAAHYAMRLWDLKDLDESTLHEDLKPCLEAYKQALKDNHIEIIKEYIEQPICSLIYRYGITPDRICLVKDELSILELKFVSVLQSGVALQTAAQKLAANEFYKTKVKRRFVLQITREGEAKPLKEYKEKGDENAWLCFLGSYNWLKKNGGNNEKRNHRD